jgi:hypothetical protein
VPEKEYEYVMEEIPEYEQPKPSISKQKEEVVEAIKIPNKTSQEEGRRSDRDILREEFGIEGPQEEKSSVEEQLPTPQAPPQQIKLLEKKPSVEEQIPTPQAPLQKIKVKEEKPFVKQQFPTSQEPWQDEQRRLKDEKLVVSEKPGLGRQQDESCMQQHYLFPHEQQQPDEQLNLKKDEAMQEETKVQKPVESTEPQRVPRQLDEGEQSPLVSRLQPQQEQVPSFAAKIDIESSGGEYEAGSKVERMKHQLEEQQLEDISFVRSKSADSIETYHEGEVREKVKLWEEITHAGELPSLSVGK